MEKAKYYKSLWKSALETLEIAIAEGTLFYPQIETVLSQTEPSRAEYALGSRYMPRGFYCPSPDIDCFITNMRRGKIAKRITTRSKPTFFYVFNEENKLFLSEEYYSTGTYATEYILHKKDVSYGFIYDESGYMTNISVEQCAENQLHQYLWATCSYNKEGGYKFHWVIQENFDYVSKESIETDFYNIQVVPKQVYISRWKSSFELNEHKEIMLHSRCELLFEEEHLKDIEDSLKPQKKS